MQNLVMFIHSDYKPRLEFRLEGDITDVIYKGGDQIKYLKVMTTWGQLYWVKLAKSLRRDPNLRLHPGQTISIQGEKKYKKTGELKLKALEITSIRSQSENISGMSWVSTPTSPNPPAPVAKSSSSCGKILVCQKSDCRKRGGDAVCHDLEKVLAQQGLDNHVTIQPTGCLKDCKAGPNLVVMPHKTRYRRIQPTEVPALVEKHFCN